MTEATNKKWSDEKVATLTTGVGNESPVSPATVEKLAETLGVTVRSVAAKLRQLGVEVASMAKEKVSAFSAEESSQLDAFVVANEGQLTYKEIAEQFAEGKFTAKQIQGKLLAMELTSLVKPTEKVEVARTYTEAEEAQFLKMAKSGAFIEEIAAALGKSVPSVRGKALSLTRSGELDKIPTQKESHAKENADPIEALGEGLVKMTVAEIAKATDKTERGIRTALTRRGIKVADYDGAGKRAKAEGRRAGAAA